MKKLLIYFIFILGILVAGLTTIQLRKSNLSPVSHAAMKVVLNQNQDYSLSLKSISGENSYSSDYKLEKPFGFYIVKILDGNNRELFTGKIEKNKVSFPPYQIGEEEIPEEENKLIFEPMSELSLLLPYYKNAEKIIFFNEDNTEALTIDAKDIDLPKNYSSNFCGNGICDSNENIFFCYNDCRSRN